MEELVAVLEQHINEYTFKMNNDNDQSDLERHQALIKAMEAELTKQEKMKQRLFDSWEADDGMYTRDEFIERKQKYTSNIEKIKKQIQEAKQNAPEPVNYEELIMNLHFMIDCIRNPEWEPEKKNFMLKQFIDRIEYDAIDYGAMKGGKAVLDLFLK